MRNYLFLLLGLCFSANLSALGLGEIELESGLDQPLKAKVHLRNVEPADLTGLSVSIASEDMHQRAGVGTSKVTDRFIFEVVADQGKPYVLITTEKPIRDPFLDFLVEVTWPAGKLLHEYTVLLDPPSLVNEKPEPLTAPVLEERLSEMVTTQTLDQQASIPPKRNQQANHPKRTQRHDTLWNIADDMRPSADISIQQVMLALFEKNPEAFVGNNINNLKAGYVMRLPDLDTIKKYEKNAARKEADRQYQDWIESRRTRAPPAELAQLSNVDLVDRSTTTDNPAARSTKPQLRLVVPSDKSEQDKGPSDGELGQLRNDMAIALEAADATRQENDELRSRMAALEQQLQSMQKIIAIKEGTLNSMQGEVLSNDPLVTGDTSPAATISLSNEAPGPKVEIKEPATSSPSLWSDPIFIISAGFVGLMLLIILWALSKRRQQEELTPMESYVEEYNSLNEKTSDDVIGQPDISSSTNADYMSSIESIETEESELNPLDDAETYLKYRRFDQAEALMLDSIEESPENNAFKVKLFEIYYRSKNAEGFSCALDNYSEAVMRDIEGWEKVKHYGLELCPSHAVFLTPVDEHNNTLESDSSGEPEPIEITEESIPPVNEQDDEADEYASEHSLAADVEIAGDKEKEDDGSIDFEGGLSDGLSPLVTDKADDLESNNSGNAALSIDVNKLNSNESASQDMSVETEASTENDKRQQDQEWMDTLNEELVETESEGLFESGENLDDELEGDLDEMLDSLDDVATKLDLARAYVDMEDNEGAREILEEVLKEGNEEQKKEAEALLQETN